MYRDKGTASQAKLFFGIAGIGKCGNPSAHFNNLTPIPLFLNLQ
jgi:hypothetical protein